MPTRKTIVLVKDGRMDRNIASILKANRAFVIDKVDHFQDVARKYPVPPDLVIASYDSVARLRRRSEADVLQLIGRTELAVALYGENLLGAAEVLDLADSWLFIDALGDQIAGALALALEGYSVVPESIRSQLRTDVMRRALVARMSTVERDVLRALGSGHSNRQIAEDLSLEEARVRALVRTVLERLHFRNRTEAGVFAALERIRRRTQVQYQNQH